MVCDAEFTRLPNRGGITEVLYAKAKELYRIINESPNAFVEIAGRYQELRELIKVARHKLMALESELKPYEEFLSCVMRHYLV